jgi:hypothetical protein
MSLALKKVKCDCGEIVALREKKKWCDKCGKPVFYDPKDARRHKINNIYIVTLVVAAFTFLTYIFLEMIASPLLK